MPIGAEGTQNQILDAWLGPARAAGCPNEYAIEGWYDDPNDDDAEEADFAGYAAEVRDSDDWDDADGGEKEVSSLVSLGTPTADDAGRVRYFALRNTTTGNIAFSDSLDEPAEVIEDVEVQIRPVIRWVRRSA